MLVVVRVAVRRAVVIVVLANVVRVRCLLRDLAVRFRRQVRGDPQDAHREQDREKHERASREHI